MHMTRLQSGMNNKKRPELPLDVSIRLTSGGWLFVKLNKVNNGDSGERVGLLFLKLNPGSSNRSPPINIKRREKKGKKI